MLCSTLFHMVAQLQSWQMQKVFHCESVNKVGIPVCSGTDLHKRLQGTQLQQESHAEKAELCTARYTNEHHA
jgi:hypothetical protein